MHRRPKWVVLTDCWAGEMVQMTFMGKQSASHNTAGWPQSIRGQTGNRTHYYIMSLLNTSCFLAQMSVRTKPSPCFRMVSRDLCLWDSIEANPCFIFILALSSCLLLLWTYDFLQKYLYGLAAEVPSLYSHLALRLSLTLGSHLSWSFCCCTW